MACQWKNSSAEMISYHDKEWGVPTHEDQKLFEYLLLESMEAAHLFQDFVERCGASICKDLRGIGKEKPLCSCEDCIKEAIALLY